MCDSTETTLKLNPDQKVIQALHDGFKVIGLGLTNAQSVAAQQTLGISTIYFQKSALMRDYLYLKINIK